MLELSHVVAGPYAGQLLADLGADIVKVEHPEHGDYMRSSGDAGRAIFIALNRGKRSVGLDLKTDADREAFRSLVEKADVVVENYGPGVMESLDLAPADLRDANPELVYLSIKGFDVDGPYSDQVATDPIFQAMSGLMSITGHADSPPARAGASVVDVTTALNGVIATMLALWRRSETGEGDHVTVPMFRSSVSLMGYWLVYAQLYDRNPQRRGASNPLYAPYDVYPTADGYAFVGAASDGHWESIRDVLDVELEYDGIEDRLENRNAIDDAIVAATESRMTDRVLTELLEAGVPAAPVNEIDDVVTDEHLKAVDAFATIDAAEKTNVRVPATVP